jgi:TRAP transporter TAXI family solute receptor
MLNGIRLLGLAVATAFAAGTAAAQTTYGLATLPPGALLNALSSVIAKAVQDNSKLQVRVQGYGGDSGVFDAIANKSSDFLALDIAETADAYHGRGTWEGKPRPTLRTAMTIYGFQVAPFVRKDSPVQSIADLRGKRVPGVWAQQTGVLRLSIAMLANGGIAYGDVQSVPVVNVVRAAEDFKAGKLDMFFFAVGAPKVQEVAAAVGGVRLVPYSDAPEAVRRMQAVRPEYYLTQVKPAPHIAGVEKPAQVQTFDFIIGVGTHVPDEVVYEFVKAVHGSKKTLVEGHPSFNLFNPDNAGKLQPTLPHHPGAIKFFKDAGIWRG